MESQTGEMLLSPRLGFSVQFTAVLSFLIGLLRDAEQQFRSSLKIQPFVTTYLELCNVYTRLDLPNTALDLLREARFRCNRLFFIVPIVSIFIPSF